MTSDTVLEEDTNQEECVCCCNSDLGEIKLREGENKRVFLPEIIPFKIRGVEVDLYFEKILKRRPDGSQYEKQLAINPGEPYGRDKPTVMYYSTRKGDHLTVINKGELHGNSINYLSGLFFCRQDRVIRTK